MFLPFPLLSKGTPVDLLAFSDNLSYQTDHPSLSVGSDSHFEFSLRESLPLEQRRVEQPKIGALLAKWGALFFRCLCASFASIERVKSGSVSTGVICRASKISTLPTTLSRFRVPLLHGYETRASREFWFGGGGQNPKISRFWQNNNGTVMCKHFFETFRGEAAPTCPPPLATPLI